MNNLINEAKRAVDFYERCKADPKTASETGAFNDAWDWFKSITEELAKQKPLNEDVL